jgi:hypothetical protein
MPNPNLPRAYCLPSEYCIFYRHRLPDADKRQIAENATKKLLTALSKLDKEHQALFSVFDSHNRGVPRFDFNKVRVHTINSHQPEDNPNCISLVVIELDPPAGYADWEDVFKHMEHGPAKAAAREVYAVSRFDVVKSVIELYKPLQGNYPDGPGDTENKYFDDQAKIIANLNDPADPNEGIMAVSPHWRMTPSPNDGPPPLDSGGPGARPIDYQIPEAGPRSLKFRPSVGQEIWWESGAEDNNVHVVVLDSIPKLDIINDKQEDVTLLDDLLDHEILQPVNLPDIVAQVGNVFRTSNFHAIYDDPVEWNVLPTSNPVNRPASYARGHNYKMPDHGLFVSGIIRSIEPKAQIHLIQVLNDFGIGNLETVWCGMVRYWNYQYLLFQAQFPNALDFKKHFDAIRLVFNCSLGFDTPPTLELERLEKVIISLPHNRPEYRRAIRFHKKLQRELGRDPLYRRLLEWLSDAGDPLANVSQHEFIALLWPSFAGMQALFSQPYFDFWRKDEPDPDHQAEAEQENVNLHLMLAAAGNGRKVGKIHPSANFPANDPLVIGVGALSVPMPPPPARRAPANLEQVAEYSNIADAPPDTGYYVFGGGAPSQPVADTQDSPDTVRPEGIVGIHTGPLPTGNDPSHGLAEWAGTSFATPVLSGILAAIFRHNKRHPLTVLKENIQPITKTEAQVPYLPVSVNSDTPAAPDPAIPDLSLQVIQVVQDR